MKMRILFSVLSASLSVSGCAAAMSSQNSGNNTPPPTAPAIYAPVANADNQTTVTQYVPVALPGQLMPIPSAMSLQSPAFTNPTDAVAYANKNATEVPQSASQFFNSMMTYDYMDGALYTVFTAPGQLTDIQLAPGEKLISEAAGDTLRWQIAQTYSGSGDDEVQHILVKPNLGGLTTNMIIMTDQRVYHLILRSSDNSSNKHSSTQNAMASVSWNYASAMVNSADASSSPSITSAQDDSPQVDLQNLDFNYQAVVVQGLSQGIFKGFAKPAWFPTRIFNDGKRTFIQLPDNYSPSQLPVLFVADDSGNYASMVNWRYRAPYIMIDNVVTNMRLQSGVKSTGETIVQITGS